MNISVNLVLITICFIAFDVLSGYLGAIVRGNPDSAIMREGGGHKLMLIIAISFGVFLDWAQYMADIGLSIPASSCICGYIVMMETLSICENICKAYPQAMPQSLVKLLKTTAEEHEVKTEDKKDDDQV